MLKKFLKKTQSELFFYFLILSLAMYERINEEVQQPKDT